MCVYTGSWCKILPLQLGLRITLGNTDLRQDSMLNAEPGQSADQAHKFNNFSSHIAMQQWYIDGHRQTRETQTLYSIAEVWKWADDSCFLCKMRPDEWERSHCTFRLEETSLLPACGLWRLMPLDRQPGAQRNPNVPEAKSSVFLPSWPIPNFCILVCSK